jgi:WD40 repeat protein
VAVAFSTDGETLISASWDKTIKIGQIKTNKEIASLRGHTDSISSVAISHDGLLIASGSKDKTIKLWHQ